MSSITDSLGIQTETIPRIACPHCEIVLDVSEFDVFDDIACPSCEGVIKVPAQLGDFLLLDDLGHGAMGRVYLARDESLMRMVALKVIKREFGDDPKMLEAIQREAQAMAALNHRNIAQIHSFGRVNGQPYFVMELLEGERLEELIKRPRQISEVKLLKIALDVSYGLAAAEAAGMTHGDIKPANILMNQKRVAKLVDFGLARFMDANTEVEVWGTPYYLAPEKVQKKGEDGRSDQYSLGATLYHAFTGKPPYTGDKPKDVVLASLKNRTPRISESRQNVSEKTDQVIRRMMNKDPDRRYQSYAKLTSDLKIALREIKTSSASGSMIPVRSVQVPQPAVKKQGTPLFVKLTWGVLALALIGFSVFLWQKGVFSSSSSSSQGGGGVAGSSQSSGPQSDGQPKAVGLTTKGYREVSKAEPLRWESFQNGKKWAWPSPATLVDAMPFQMLPENEFTLGILLQMPTSTLLSDPERNPLFQTGLVGANTVQPTNGFKVLMRHKKGKQTPIIRVRIGKNNNSVAGESFELPRYSKDTPLLITVSWKGSERKLKLHSNGAYLGEVVVAENQLPEKIDDPFLNFGRSIVDRDGKLFGRNPKNIRGCFVLDFIPDPRQLYSQYQSLVPSD